MIKTLVGLVNSMTIDEMKLIEVKELIDTYKICLGYVDCAAANVLLKGKYCEPDYIKTCNRLDEASYSLNEWLNINGSVTINGRLWEVGKLCQ